MKIFCKHDNKLSLDRKNELRAALQLEAAKVEVEINAKNEAAKKKVEEAYEADKLAWEQQEFHAPPFKLQAGMIISQDKYVLIEHIDSFAWSKGYGPIEYNLSPKLEILVTSDGKTFERMSHYSLIMLNPDQVLRMDQRLRCVQSISLQLRKTLCQCRRRQPSDNPLPGI